MSIVRMRKVFRAKSKMKVGKKTLHLPSPAEAVFYLIILIFVAGAYYTFGGPGGGKNASANQGGGGAQTAVVARVNGEKIPRQLYDANLQMRLQGMGDERDITQERYLRSGTLSSLEDAIMMRQATRKEGIKVSGADLSAEKDKQIEQMVSQRFPDKRSLVRFLKKENKSLDQYKDDLRKEAFSDSEALREQVARQKLQKAVEDKVTMTDADVADSYSEVKASHILIDPKKEAAAAQAGQKDPKAAPADGDALAKKKAEDLLAQIQKGADFAKLAKENSADPGSAVKGGDLGWFKKGMMVPEFDAEAFKLQPGQVSSAPVKSDFGYHIIKVTARRQNLPKDFNQNKEMYKQQALQEKKSRAWQEFQQQMKKDAKIEIIDPELKAYSLLDDGKEAEGIAALDQVVNKDPQNAVAAWELAQLYDQKGDKAKTTELLEKVTLTEDGARNPMVHIRLADLYQQQNNKPKALDEYKNAFDRASGFTMQNFSANMQIEQKLKQLGDTTTVPQVSKWLADYRKQQAENPMGGFGGQMGNFQIPSQ
ncbi:MAG: peptidylprolyl isomerase [Bacteroidota bacterium]